VGAPCLIPPVDRLRAQAQLIEHRQCFLLSPLQIELGGEDERRQELAAAPAVCAARVSGSACLGLTSRALACSTPPSFVAPTAAPTAAAVPTPYRTTFRAICRRRARRRALERRTAASR
jgi:hypothetical protein